MSEKTILLKVTVESRVWYQLSWRELPRSKRNTLSCCYFKSKDPVSWQTDRNQPKKTDELLQIWKSNDRLHGADQLIIKSRALFIQITRDYVLDSVWWLTPTVTKRSSQKMTLFLSKLPFTRTIRSNDG